MRVRWLLAAALCVLSCVSSSAATGQWSDTLTAPSRALLQQAQAPAPSSALIGLTASGNIQIPVRVLLLVTCPLVVPFNQLSEQVIGDALQASFPPNTTLVSITMEEQISKDTVLVSTSLIIWEAMIPILLANKCCVLEVLYLQHAVARISPNAIGQNVSMSLIEWQIGSMHNAPSTAPAAAPATSLTASSVNGTTSSASYVYPLDIPQDPLIIGGVTSDLPALQANGNYTMVDIFVRTIANGNPTATDLPSDTGLALAHRSAMKALVFFMGTELEVLDMQDSSNTSLVPSVDSLNRLWVPSTQLSYQAYTAQMWRVASHAPLQYAQMMNQSGYSVELDVLNATVVDVVLNNSLPSIQVMPPLPPMNTNPASLLMTLDFTSSALLPFTTDKQRMLTGIVIQVLQQYGGLFVSIQSVNTSSTESLIAPLGRKLLAVPGTSTADSAQASDSLQVSMLVTAPAEDQVQLLSPVCPAKVAQSLTAAGYQATASLVSASLVNSAAPFSRVTNLSSPQNLLGGSGGDGGRGLSGGKRAAAIAVPVIVGALLAASLAALLAIFLRRRQCNRKVAQAKAAAVAAAENDPKLAGSYGGDNSPGQGKEGKPGQAVMDTAMRLQSTGGANSYQSNDVLETDTEYSDKLTITHMSTPERPNRSIQDSGMDIQATQAGAVRRVLGRMHAREQELSNALAETSTFAMHHLQAGAVFRKKYSLTGARWRSPRAVWCSADQVQEPWGPVALKMYALTSDFIREKELLDMPYSSEHWPKVYDTYTYSDVGFEGDACPPCIVMQPPLTTLQSWMDTQDRTNLVWDEQVATLYNLCKALQSFHSRGMVHCSLSPPDFSWYQGGQGWKVASCGDWAQQGMHVRSCYSLRYASPEAVQGDLFDVAGAAADPAMDMWAVGAIAFEIFTGRAYFSRKTHTDSDIVNMLLGFEPLPSESQAAFWHRIREPAAQRLVQNLLRRVPGQRSTINEVLASPIFNVFTQTSATRRVGRRSLWSKDFVSKLTNTASSLRSMESSWSEEGGDSQQRGAQSRAPPPDAQGSTGLLQPGSNMAVQAGSDMSRPGLPSIQQGMTDAQDKESLQSRESLQSQPPSITDTQEKDVLQSQPSSVLNSQDKDPSYHRP